jgi:tetratricopeptide (TPR) repeat protein
MTLTSTSPTPPLNRFNRVSPRLLAALLSTLLGTLFGFGLVWNNVKPRPIATALAPTDRYRLDLDLPGTSDRRQRLQDEIALYQTKVQQTPTSGLELAALASAYWKTGKASGEVSWYLLAEQTAQSSIAQLPFNNTSAPLILAQVAQARHDFAQAKTIAQAVLKTAPNNNEALALLATGNLATGNLALAYQQATHLVNALPNLSNLTLLGQVEAAQGKASAAATFRLAMQTEEAGEIGGSALARVMLGRHFYQRGDLPRAASLYQEALRILPHYPLALLHLAALETRRGNYDQADRYYDQVIAYSQQAATIYDHTVLRGKARLLQLQGKPYQAQLAQAEAVLRKETNAGHENGAFGHNRELAQLLLDRNQGKDASEALGLMQKEIKIRRDAQTLGVLARALGRNDRWPEAQQAIRSALTQGTQNAGLFMELGNAIQAQTYKIQAQAIDPSFDDRAQRSLGLDPL